MKMQRFEYVSSRLRILYSGGTSKLLGTDPNFSIYFLDDTLLKQTSHIDAFFFYKCRMGYVRGTLVFL